MSAETGTGRLIAAAAVAIISIVPPVVLMSVAFASGINADPGAWGFVFVGVAFGLIGTVIIIRVPGNRMGWVFGGISVALTLSGFQTFARPLLESGMDVSLVAIGQVLADAAFTTMLFLVLVITPSWFPTGRPLSRRWGWPNIPATAAWGATVLMALSSPETKIQWDPALDQWRTLANPLGVSGIPDFQTSLAAGVGVVAILVAAIAAVVSLFVRYRRPGMAPRAQIRWLLASFLFLIPVVIVSALVGEASTGVFGVVGEILSMVAFLLVPIAAGMAITKYRLYDIDVVISKTVTYGVLAAFITGVYALVVAGIGSLFGSGDEPNLALSIVAVAIVAVAFEPLRRRVQHWANVLVYGKRATPYEVLSKTSARLSDTRDPDQVLTEITRLVVDGTGASETVLWLTVGEAMHPRASSPADVVEGLVPVTTDADPSSVLPGDRVVAIRHRGEVLGALSISKERGDSVTTADEKVLGDVAAGAGVLLRNLGLNAELGERAGQLRVSRRRLVAAHDAERHRLERDLHDGAQQQVVALKVKLGIARTLAEREGAVQVAELVSSLSDTAQDAVDGMRAVAHGIYPPLLEAEGLVAALTAATRSTPVPVTLEATGLGRYERSIEESVYFAVLGILSEAVDQGATAARISLKGEDRLVGFSVLHDGGVGDLVAVEDRVDAFGGSLTVARDPGAVVVSGQMPTDATFLVFA